MIVIGSLHIGNVTPEWLTSWDELEKPITPEGKADWMTYRTVRQLIHVARNDAVKFALERDDVTHVFFLDDDVLMPKDGLTRLLSRNLPVVTGLYIQRGDPMLPVVYRKHPEGRYVHLTRFCAGLQEIDACGAGCLLIRADVLRAIQATGEPWFDWDRGCSEDIAFCERVKALGYPIVLDYDVKCGHIGMVEITCEMFLDREERGQVTYATEEIARVSQEVRPWPR